MFLAGIVSWFSTVYGHGPGGTEENHKKTTSQANQCIIKNSNPNIIHSTNLQI